MQKGEKMEVPVEARAVPGHQGVEDSGHLPDPEDTDAQDPVKPGHSGKPTGKAKGKAAHRFGALPHGQYGERRRNKQKDHVTCYMGTENEFAAGKEGELSQGHAN